MTDKVSKGKVIETICEQLNVTDYTLLPDSVAQLVNVVVQPLWGVTVVWKPGVPGSQQVNVLGVPHNPQAAQQVSDVLSMCARQFTEQALQMAAQPPTPTPEENSSDVRNDNVRTPE